MLLAAVDDRLSCAVVSSGNTENFACADFIPPGSTDDAEQNFIGSGPLGFDRWDLLYPSFLSDGSIIRTGRLKSPR